MFLLPIDSVLDRVLLYRNKNDTTTLRHTGSGCNRNFQLLKKLI